MRLSTALRGLPGARDWLLGYGWRLLAMAVLTLALLVTPGSVLADEAWVSGWPQGEGSAEVTALAIAPSDGRVIYASTPMAVYRSDNGGASWLITSPFANVVALAVHPGNSDVIYAFCWPNRPGAPQHPHGFWKSVDGGRSWSDPTGGAFTKTIGSAVSVSVLAADPTSPQTLFAGTSRVGQGRILRSTDGGQTWQVTYTVPIGGVGPASITAIIAHPATRGVVYAAHTVYHGGAMLRSDDGGLSWRQLAVAPEFFSHPAALALDPTDSNIVYAAYQLAMGGGVHVYRTGDGGASWLKASEGLSTIGTSLPQLVVDPFDPRVLYLSTMGDNGGIHRTTDRGNSWVRLLPEEGSRFKYVRALGYDPVGQTLYAGTNEGVWQREVLPAVADAFVRYYNSHDGWRLLGRPVSPPTGTSGFVCQYFEKGRLEDHSQEVTDPKWRLMYGLLADQLQEASASLPVGGDTSTVSYADIHVLARPDRRVSPPANFVSGVRWNADGSVFVPYHPQLQRESGHNVPAIFWNYIGRGDLFPGGWLHDVGLPMAEAVEATVDKGPVKGRKILIQAFQRTVLTYDPLNPAEWQVERANVGTDYLKVFPEKARP